MFIDTQIPLPRESKAVTEIAFKNAILVDSTYNEQRIPQSTEPKFKWDIDETYFREFELNTFISFITDDAKGKLNTFRYRHPYFNSCTAYRSYFGVNNHVYQRGILIPIKDSLTNYQFAIEFGVLDTQSPNTLNTNLFIDPNTPRLVAYKTITKVSTEFKIYDANGVLIPTSDWNLTLTSGVVVFNTPRLITDKFYVTAKFDLEVRFDTDDLQIELVTKQVSTPYLQQQCEDLFKFTSLNLVEVITNKATPPKDDTSSNRFFNQINTRFDIGIQPKVSIASIFQTKIDTFDTGFESRVSRISGNRFSTTLLDTVLIGDQAQYLFTFFVACKGNLNKFKILDNNDIEKSVRFKDESLRLSLTRRREACGDLYDLSSCSFVGAVFN